MKFSLNDYITLRLEDNETIIYVDGQRFNQCKFLLLDIRTDQIKDFETIDSIDKAEQKLSKDMEGKDRYKFEISPKTEFIAHCSNLQAWVENKYDTRILHRNIAFPLLKKLVDAGDQIARQVFKEEIAKRLLSGHQSVVKYLINEGYIEYLGVDELITLLDEPKVHIEVITNLILKNDITFVQKILKRMAKKERLLLSKYLIWNKRSELMEHSPEHGRELLSLIDEELKELNIKYAIRRGEVVLLCPICGKEKNEKNTKECKTCVLARGVKNVLCTEKYREDLKLETLNLFRQYKILVDNERILKFKNNLYEYITSSIHEIQRNQYQEFLRVLLNKELIDLGLRGLFKDECEVEDFCDEFSRKLNNNLKQNLI